MTNICKRIPLLFISLLLLSGCGKGKSKSSDTQPQDVKVESISFKLMTDTVYINHYAYIQEFEVLPKSATNKDVKWSLSDSEAGRFDGDLLFALKPGNINIICEALDGSNTKFELPLHILNYEKPETFNVDNQIFVYKNVEFNPSVTVSPDSDCVDSRYVITIPEASKDVVDFAESGSLIGKKFGAANIQVAPLQEPTSTHDVTVNVEEDLLSSSTSNSTGCSFLKEYEGRNSVATVEAPFKANHWQSFDITLPDHFNLATSYETIDVKAISGYSWIEFQFLDIDKNTIKKSGTTIKISFDLTKGGPWANKEIGSLAGEYPDVYHLRCYVNATPQTGEPNVKMALDNFIIHEI